MEKLLAIFAIVLILSACDNGEQTEYLSETENNILTMNNYSDSPPLEEVEELNCLTEGDENMGIYEMCWVEAMNTQRGQDLFQDLLVSYNSVFFSDFGSFPDLLFARDVTFGAVKEGLERALIPISSRTITHGIEYTYDLSPFAEAAGLQRATWWENSERFTNLLNDFHDAFGRWFSLNPYENPGETSPIGIDDLERAVRRSIEDGVDYVSRAILSGEFTED